MSVVPAEKHVFTIEQQLELLRIAKERLDDVVEIIESALRIAKDGTEAAEVRIVVISDKLSEALIALQGPKKNENGND